MSVELRRVADLAEQVRGVSYSKADASLEPQEGYVPVLRAGNISDSGLEFDDLVYVPKAKVKRKQLVRANDIVIAASSGSLDVVGKAARALNDFHGGFGAFCKVLRPAKDIEPSYFAHYFKTKEYRRKVSNLAAGANINNLRNGDLDELLIPVPPLEEQKRIAKILDAADALRAKRRESLALLDALLQSTFLDLFGDPATNEKKWKAEELADVVKKKTIVTYGIVQAGEEFPGGVPYIRTGDIVDGEIDIHSLRRTDPKIAEKFSRSRLDAGDLVMSIRATVGTVAMVPSALEGANLTQGTARISPGDGLSKEYLFYYIMSNGCQSWIQRQVKGATFREITLGRLRSMPVLVPPIDLQLKFSRLVQRVDELRSRSLAHKTDLDELFMSLQQKAFKGEL